MKAKYLLLSAIFLSFVSFSQPTIEWQKSLGGSLVDFANSVQQTSDGGYIVAGLTHSSDGDVTGHHGMQDMWVVKLTMNGLVEWQRALGGIGVDCADSIKETLDGGYIVAGRSSSNDGDVTGNHGAYDFWVVKLTVAGEIEWQKSLGGSNSDLAHSIYQTTDEGYIIAGGSGSNDGDVTGNHGGNDYWVVKLNTAGEIEWQKTLGGSDHENAFSVQQTFDEGYILGGASRSNDGDVSGNNGGLDYWVVKLSVSGEMEWQKSLGGSRLDNTRSIYQAVDGGYIVAGYSYSSDGDVSVNFGLADFWLVKLSPAGEIAWEKSFGGDGLEVALSVQQTMDDGYVIAGYNTRNGGDVTGHQGARDYWVVKINSSGIIQWQKSLGGSDWEEAEFIEQTIDGGFIVAGYSKSSDGDVTGNHGGPDYWVVKLSPVLGVNENELSQSVILAPNPNNGRFSLDFSEKIEITSINVIDVLGKTVYSETNIPSGTFAIDQNFTTGVYFVNVISITSETTLKMIVE